MTLSKDRIISTGEGINEDLTYPLINKEGRVNFFPAKPNAYFGGKSMVESILNNISEVKQLTDKERLKIPNARLFIDGWRDLTEREYKEWIDKGKPWRLSVSIGQEKEAFASQLEERDAIIKQMQEQLAELMKSKTAEKEAVKEPKKEGVKP